MPFASQCLGYLNKACPCQWGLHASPRAASVASNIRATACVRSGRPGGLRTLTSSARLLPHKPPRRSAFSAALPSSTEQPPQQTSARNFTPDSLEQDVPWPRSFQKSASKNRKRGSRRDRLAPTSDNQELDDAALWAGRVSEAQRKNGPDGVLRVWESVRDHRSLSEVSGAEADVFWDTLLDAALPQDTHLADIHAYANWLLESHSAQLPNLYPRILSHCLRERQYQRAFRWHMALIADFDPGLDAFSSLLKEYVADPEPRLQDLLKSIYVTSFYRSLYDVIVPHLYDCGSSVLCVKWRDVFLAFQDLPQEVPASQPFLRFLNSYFPEKGLVSEEKAVTRLVSTKSRQIQDPSTGEVLFRSQFQRGRGKSKHFNDPLGARWFASAWIPLDFAIHALHGLGVQQIGPLSLQSIVLREPDARSIRTRLDQLRKLDVDFGQSNYAKAVRHLAEEDNDEMLGVLLQSDIHPDVFQDAETQQAILDTALVNGNWHISQLFVAIQPALTRDAVSTTSNELLRDHLLHQETRLAAGLLDDMRAMKVDVEDATLRAIHDHLLSFLSRGSLSASNRKTRTDDALTLAEKVTSLGLLVPSKFWQGMFYELGKTCRIDALERLAIGLVDNFQVQASRKPGLVSVHPSDSPLAPAESTSVMVPTDLSISHDWHPIRRIFSSRQLQRGMIHWGFQKGLGQVSKGRLKPEAPLACQSPSDFHIARGVRLLKELGDHGMPLEVRFIRAEVVSCLARHWATEDGQKGQNHLKIWPNIGEMVKLFNEALGKELLPEAAELRDLLVVVRQRESAVSSSKPAISTERERRL